jgi:hypothetical protein
MKRGGGTGTGGHESCGSGQRRALPDGRPLGDRGRNTAAAAMRANAAWSGLGAIALCRVRGSGSIRNKDWYF